MTLNAFISNTGVYALESNLYLKCEWQNLTGTPKTRLVHARLHRLEQESILEPGMSLYDVSTGSEAAALAQFGALKGYQVHVWLPDYAEPGFIRYIERFGAQVDLVDGHRWLLEGAQKAKAAAAHLGGFYFNQADALEDAKAAYGVLGREFAQQLRDQNVTPQALVSVIGSGGLLLGTASGMRELFPDMKVYAIELDQAPYLHSAIHQYSSNIARHHVWGIGAEESTRMKKELEALVDDVLLISEDEMRSKLSSIPRELGISVDYPTASNLLGAEQLQQKGLESIATIWTGHGWRTLL